MLYLVVVILYDVAKEILSVIRDTNSTESLSALVCDGTNNNTGKRNGIIRKLEESLGMLLQRVLCLLHFNALPFESTLQQWIVELLQVLRLPQV